MTKPILLLAAMPLLLAACDATQTTTGGSGQFISDLPEGVLEIAAPYQDLSSVRIDETDGCYVYRYRGPVETTYLPLRATNGRPICTRAPESAEAAG